MFKFSYKFKFNKVTGENTKNTSLLKNILSAALLAWLCLQHYSNLVSSYDFVYKS